MAGKVIGQIGRSACVAALVASVAGCSATVPATSSPSSSIVPTSQASTVIATSSPIPTAVPSSPTATANATLSPTTQPCPMTTPTVTVSPEPIPTAGADGWIGPLQIDTADYEQLSMAVDAGGFVHAAFVRNDRIQYLTNRNGAWSRQRVTSPDGRDSEPSIALDSDGSVWIAFTRWAPVDPDYCRNLTECIAVPQGVYYVTNESGGWSAADPLGPPQSSSPSIEVRDGAVHLSYVSSVLCGDLCGAVDVRYKTNQDGSWTDSEVGLTWGPPELEIGSDGSAHLAHWNLEWDDETSSYRYVVLYTRVDRSTGVASTETVWDGEEPSEAFWVQRTLLELDAADNPEIVAQIVISDEGADAIFHLVRQPEGWIEASAPPIGSVHAAALDTGGSLHLLACCTEYLTNRSGEYEEHFFNPDQTVDSLVGDMAIDNLGRPHMLFRIQDADGGTLWYAVGPSDN